MNNLLRTKLSVMMGLQFFIWGCWLPLIYSYLPSLGFKPAQQSWILNAFPMAAVIGLFFSNQFADRHFAAERFFGFSHLVGGTAMLLLAFTRGALTNFQELFLVPLVTATLAAAALALFFRPPIKREPSPAVRIAVGAEAA